MFDRLVSALITQKSLMNSFYPEQQRYRIYLFLFNISMTSMKEIVAYHGISCWVALLKSKSHSFTHLSLKKRIFHLLTGVSSKNQKTTYEVAIIFQRIYLALLRSMKIFLGSPLNLLSLFLLLKTVCPRTFQIFSDTSYFDYRITEWGWLNMKYFYFQQNDVTYLLKRLQAQL